VAEHLLHAAQVGAAFQQVRRKRVAEQVRVDSSRFETGFRGAFAEDQKRARTSERPSLRVQKQLRAMTPVEVRPPAGEVTAECLHRLAADRDDALLIALADAAHESVVERDAAFVERARLRDAQARAVQELDQRPVAEVARLRPGGRFDESLGFAGRKSSR